MKLNIPNGTVRLDDVYLKAHKNVKKVSLPKTLRELPLGAFYQCIELRKIFFSPEIKLTKIPEACFQGCVVLKEIIIPKSVVSIENHAFKDVTSIKEFEIPDTVTFVDAHAFDGWKEYQIIYIYNENIKLSSLCLAEVVLLKEEEQQEASISDHHYMVIAKGGHVGRDQYMPMYIPIKASSKKEAAFKVTHMPRVKKDHKDKILDVYKISKEVFYKQVENNKKDPYFQAHSKQEQNQHLDSILSRVKKDTHFKPTKNKKIVRTQPNI